MKGVLALTLAMLGMPVLCSRGDEGKPAPKKASLGDLRLAKTELPKGSQFDKGPGSCISTQLESFYASPECMGALPKPSAQNRQAILGQGEDRGVVLYLDYGSMAQDVEAFLPCLLWGEAGGPTKTHPEEVLCVGHVLVVLSFPPGSDVGARVKECLAAKLKAQGEVKALGKPVQDEPAAAEKDGEPFASSKPMFEGQALFQGGEFAGAEKAFRKALTLHEGGDPMPGEFLYVSTDCLAQVLQQQQRIEESVPYFEKALAVLASLDDQGMRKVGGRDHCIASTEYNLACALARLGRFDAALRALKHSISLEPRRKESARRDTDFEKALARADFRALLK